MRIESPNERRLALKLGLAGTLAAAGLPARACEFWTPTLRVTHPWTRASADGQTSAVLCMKFDQVQKADRLIGAQTMVAERIELATPGQAAGAEIDVAIPLGRETLLSEHGAHLRLVGLLMPLELGRTYPLELQFEHGGTMRADLSVDYTRFR
jgi:copper(I)-binding protein